MAGHSEAELTVPTVVEVVEPADRRVDIIILQ
jgi:hypothetical protein